MLRKFSTGRLIVNADDWGRDEKTTARSFACFERGTLSSVSAMVFMEGSERAAAVAREHGIDAGLHLNLTTPFSALTCPGPLRERQGDLARYLRRHPWSQMVFNPWLACSFEYVVNAQIEEFSRVYGSTAERLDGHHHMHLCANVLMGGLLPSGAVVRRNFSFARGEKSLVNRLYRLGIDRILSRRHVVTDFFFSLAPLESRRIERILSLAKTFAVEVETHPVDDEEYRYLMRKRWFDAVDGVRIATSFAQRR